MKDRRLEYPFRQEGDQPWAEMEKKNMTNSVSTDLAYREPKFCDALGCGWTWDGVFVVGRVARRGTAAALLAASAISTSISWSEGIIIGVRFDVVELLGVTVGGRATSAPAADVMTVKEEVLAAVIGTGAIGARACCARILSLLSGS